MFHIHYGILHIGNCIDVTIHGVCGIILHIGNRIDVTVHGVCVCGIILHIGNRIDVTVHGLCGIILHRGNRIDVTFHGVCVWYYFTYRKSYRCYSLWCVCVVLFYIQEIV